MGSDTGYGIEEEFDPAILGLPALSSKVKVEVEPIEAFSFNHAPSVWIPARSRDHEPAALSEIQIKVEVPDRAVPVVTRRTALDLLREFQPIDVKQETSVKVELDSPIIATDTNSEPTILEVVDKPPTPPLSPVVSPKRFHARLVRRRLPRSRRSRMGIRIIHPLNSLPFSPSTGADMDADPVTKLGHSSDDTAFVAVPKPAHPLLGDIAAVFGTEATESIEAEAKVNAITGCPLPHTVRDLFPALDDLPTAVNIANNLRTQLGLPKLVMGKKNRIQILRQVARMRENMYLTLISSLILPHAPVLGEDEDAEEEKVEEAIQLTPVNLEVVATKLPKVFPKEKALIKAFMPMAMGEQSGRVLWNNGVGKIVGAEGGFRGKVFDGDTHVFVDHSNVLYGLLAHLYPSSATSLPPRHLRTISLPLMSLLLRRGRATPPGTLHLVASSPLKQDLDPVVRLGFEVSVLKRVELCANEVEDPDAMKLTPKLMERLPSGDGVVAGGLKRFKEQGVDEILHLKILQTLNNHELGGEGGKKRTIVLATGDAKGGQFNKDGFLGAVKEALKRGWSVELWSWSDGLSRAWKEVSRRERWGERFSIHLFDEWAEQLVEVQRGG